MTETERYHLEEDNRLTLSDIFDIVQTDLYIILNLKDKLQKVYQRLDPVSINLILNKYFLVEAVNNHFANCILLGQSIECYRDFIIENVKEHTSEDSIILDVDPDCKRFFLDLVYPLLDHVYKVHAYLIRDVHQEKLSKTSAISIGKMETLRVYFCCITILYGLRFFDESRNVVFFIQPYYKSIKINSGDYLMYCAQKLCGLKPNSVTISYRFCSPDYTDEGIWDFNDESIKRFHVFQDMCKESKVFIAFIKNTNITPQSFSVLVEEGVIFDDDSDYFDDFASNLGICSSIENPVD